MDTTVVPFHLLVTYLRGRFELVSCEGERYRLTPAQLRNALIFYDLMLAWTVPQTLEVSVGPFSCRPSGGYAVRWFLESPDGTPRHIAVPSEWLALMKPLFEWAIDTLDRSNGTPVPDFSLERRRDGAIAELPPDRQTLHPADD